MLAFHQGEVFLIVVALVAATVNGGLGYGFSSITVPLALYVVPNRVLSPALVMVEAFINFVALLVNAGAVPSIWRRMLPLMVGLLPGAMLGTYALSQASHGALRLGTYAILLPLILLQAAGVRRPIRREALVGAPLGAGVGLLYAVTTISGPPLALLLNNQGLSKEQFRAGLSLFRIAESLITAALFASAGLFTAESTHLSAVISPSVVVGTIFGFALLRRLPAEPFRRICMGVDALLVALGLSHVLIEQGWASPLVGGAGVVVVVVLEAWILRSYFRRARGDAPLLSAASGGS